MNTSLFSIIAYMNRKIKPFFDTIRVLTMIFLIYKILRLKKQRFDLYHA